MKENHYRQAYLIYTCSFLILLPVIFYPFLSEGKSFVWEPDGLDQHYPALLYYGKLLRGILTGNGFPMVDFNIGMGFDTITTLHYYVIGDPISLLSVFMTEKNSVFFYNFLALLRLYLAGISFLILMKHLKKEGLCAALGALIYVFCGYALYAGIRHPFFTNPMIYLPLLIIGTEQVLKGRRPYLMVTMVFISTVSNFYFYYLLTIIIVIFIIFRYFTQYRYQYSNLWKGFLFTGLKTGGYYLLGTALASFLLIPVLYAFTLNGRLNARPGMLHGYLYYSKQYYYILFQDTIAANIHPPYWAILSFPVIIAVCMTILITNRRYRHLQIIYLLVILGLFIPAFGFFMNGFSYTSNRWSFLISLIIAVTFSLTYDKFFQLGHTEKILLLIEIILYGILSFFLPSRNTVKYSFYILLFIVFFIFLLQMKWFKNNKMFGSLLIYALVVISIALNGYSFYSKQYNNYTENFLSKGEVKKLTSKGALTLIKDISDPSFYRIETYGDEALNESMTVGFHDVSGYFSLMDENTTVYLMDLEVLAQKNSYRFENLDARTFLDSLASVKYFITTEKDAVPYGYKLIKKDTSGSKHYYLYQNEFALSLGYTYEKYMLRQDYDRLSALEKQNAMMTAVILDQSTDYIGKTDQSPAAGIEKHTVKITPDESVSIDNNIIDVKKSGAAITLDFNAKPNSETYVRLGELNINKKQSIMVNFNAIGDLGANKRVNVRSAYYNSYFGKENYLINSGYSSKGENKVVITFPLEMTFRYDSIEVFSVDMSNFADRINALKQASFRNIQQYNNRIQGDISLDKKGITVFSIPYSKGWSAYVDGVKTELLRANVMYMALPLEAGKHHIILTYRTPYLIPGCFVTLIALMILIGLIRYKKGNFKA